MILDNLSSVQLCWKITSCSPCVYICILSRKILCDGGLTFFRFTCHRESTCVVCEMCCMLFSFCQLARQFFCFIFTIVRCLLCDDGQICTCAVFGLDSLLIVLSVGSFLLWINTFFLFERSSFSWTVFLTTPPITIHHCVSIYIYIIYNILDTLPLITTSPLLSGSSLHLHWSQSH